MTVQANWQEKLEEKAWNLLQCCSLQPFGWTGHGLGYDIILKPEGLEDKPFPAGETVGVILEQQGLWKVLFPPYVLGAYDTVQDAALVAVGTFILDSESKDETAVAVENLEAEGLQPEIVS